MTSVRSLEKKWDTIFGSAENPYEAVESFVNAVKVPYWPYVIISEQIEFGWDDDVRSALALNMLDTYAPTEHALAAFIILSDPWPKENATTALNLLALVHRIMPSESIIDKFLSCAALRCLLEGLKDPSRLVAEEAVNILGGLGLHHFTCATAEDIARLDEQAAKVINAIDDDEIGSMLMGRVQQVLGEANASSAIEEMDARSLLADLDSVWPRLAASLHNDAAISILRTHVTALAWATATDHDVSGAIQVVRVEDIKPRSNEARWAWGGIVDHWIALVRDYLGPEREFAFEPLDVALGSFVITFRINADADTCREIARQLRGAKDVPLEGTAADELFDTLRARRLRLRVSQVDADYISASLDVKPSEAIQAPFRSRKLPSGEIPQANDLEKIYTVIECVAAGDPITPERLDVVDRQVDYYKAAARILGLLSMNNELTRAGWLVHELADETERLKRTCWLFEMSPCGQAWIEWSRGRRLSDIPVGSAREFLAERSELTGDTIGRRANTLNKWLAILRKYK